MPVQEQLPLLDAILETWRANLDKDFTAYRNHCCRMLKVALALRDCDADEQRKLQIAAAFHDLGIWSDGTVDYLPPSVLRARQYLQQQGLAHWQDEIEAMIDLHHKLRRVEHASPLVELFRKADLVDVSLGLVRFGLSRSQVAAIRGAFPNAGFHKRLLALAKTWFATHPLSPPPFLKW